MSTTLTDLEYQLRAAHDELEAIYNGEATNSDGEQASMYDYICDCLDIEYTISSRGEYIGCKLWIALGGPNVWLDTRSNEICGAWGTERAELWLPSEIAEEIDSVASECYDMVKGAY